jgi:hypothetical protein
MMAARKEKKERERVRERERERERESLWDGVAHIQGGSYL